MWTDNIDICEIIWKDNKWSLVPPAGRQHKWGSAELRLKTGDKEVGVMFWKNNLVQLFPELVWEDLTSDDLLDFVADKLPPAASIKGQIELDGDRLVRLVM